MSKNKARQRTLAGFDETPDSQNDAEPESEKPRESIDIRGKTVYAVDSHSLIFQVFHALPEMSSSTGEPVGAVYGFTRDILFLLEEKSPDFIFCAFDLPGKTFRHKLFPEYKIQRDEMPHELRPQIGTVQRLLEALRIPILSCESYEADDILATLARRCDQLDAECFVVTGDKDCRQLITDNVKVYNVRKDTVFDAAALQEEWGIRPDQVVDFQALVGDAVDNVPGIPLVGPKFARVLLEKHGTLEAVLENAAEVSGEKRRQNLLAGRDQALLSRQLVQLVNDVPVEIDFASAQVGQAELAQVNELFQELGFGGLARRFRAYLGAEVVTWDSKYQTVATPDELDALIQNLLQQERISIDTETTSLDPRQAELVGFCFAWVPGEAYYVPVRAPEGESQLDPIATGTALRPVLENPDIHKVGQNLKYDKIVLRNAGIELQGISFDTMIADYLLDAGGRDHKLDSLSQRYLNHEMISHKQLVESGSSQKSIHEITVDRVTQYAAEDADVALRLTDLLAQRLQDEGLDELFTNLELPLMEVLVDMEYAGIHVDAERLRQLSVNYGERLEELETEIYEIAGHRFNISSPKQLAEVLFDDLGLPVIKKTKTGRSTDADVLDQLAQEHPLPAKIIEYRQFAKLKNTYLDALPQMVHPQTGRVHTSFNQVIAATGRLSSNEPNLQNIPVRTREGREIRSAFRAGESGWQLLTADYSQIELRVLAHFCADENLCRAFENDEDIHATVASQVYEVTLADVTSDMRRAAKAINFGIVYGQSPFGLAKTLNIDRDDAAEYIEAYFARYPRVDQFITDTLLECRKHGYVQTILGRRRAIHGIRDPEKWARNPHQRTLPERTAINTVIQGSAADLIKLAMIRVPSRLTRDRLAARMLLQIHDELIFEVSSAEVDSLAVAVTEEMTQVQELRVELKVDVKTGVNWAECEELDR